MRGVSILKEDRERLVEQALQLQKQVFMAIHPASEPTWLQLDLTMSQVKGIFTLANEGPMPISQLAATLNIGRPAASILVDRLVELGMVERTEDAVDRRRTFARLSPEAEELVAQLRQGGRERLRACLNRLSDEDLAALLQGLKALCAATAADRTAGQPQCRNPISATE
jgi:DNA-binding MarR family transcriptional regulator